MMTSNVNVARLVATLEADHEWVVGYGRWAWLARRDLRRKFR